MKPERSVRCVTGLPCLVVATLAALVSLGSAAAPADDADAMNGKTIDAARNTSATGGGYEIRDTGGQARAGMLTGGGYMLIRWTAAAGGTSTGDGYGLSGIAGQHEAGQALTGGDFELNGGFLGPSRGDIDCITNEECATDPRATFCTFDSCEGGMCTFTPGLFGDVAGAGGACGQDGEVALNDILAVLDGFAGQFRDPCTRGNIDIGGSGGSCVPDGIISLSDILHVLDAFSGTSPCTAACNAGGRAVEAPPVRRSTRPPRPG